MSVRLEFVPQASAELDCVAGDYDASVPGLGFRFRQIVESECSRIVQHPLLMRERRGGYRRISIPGFPYYIAFVIREERVVVIAIAHASRKPEYWINRIP